ncbi:MAG: TolC family protein, partial [Spirochaetota bacterium]
LAQAGSPGGTTTTGVQEHAALYVAASSRFASLVVFDEAAPTSPAAAASGSSAGTVSGRTADSVSGTVSGLPYDLATLITLMERGSPAIAISQSAEAAARGDLSSAKAQRYPTLRAESSGAYLGNPQDAIAIPANAFIAIGFPNEPIPLIPAVDPFQYSFKLIGELPLFTWGKTSAGIKASESALGAARLQLARTMHEKRIQLQASWETLSCVAAAEEALALQVKAGQRLASLTERNQSSGFITRVELLDVRLKVKQTAVAQARLTENRERLLSDLASLAGLDGLSLEQLHLEVPAAGPAPGSEAESQEIIPTGNYDLALAKAQVEARRSLESLMKTQAKGLPDLGLRAELSYGGSRLPYTTDDWEDKTDWQLIVSIGASGRLFGDPVKAGAAVRAQAELNQARAQLEEGQHQLRSYIHESYLSLELLRSRLEYSVLQHEYWAASLARQLTILDLGAGSETEYLSLLMEALGGLAEGYGILAEYRAVLLGLQGAAGFASGID